VLSAPDPLWYRREHHHADPLQQRRKRLETKKLNPVELPGAAPGYVGRRNATLHPES